jgi:hypothetical protein
MNSTYTAALPDSSPATASATYNSVTGEIASSSSDLAALSAENYPAGNVPLKDAAGHLMPNSANQEVFKNQTASWWVSAINAKKVQYRPVSNVVNWAYVTPDGKDIHIRSDITSAVIPHRTASASLDTVAGTRVVVFTPTVYMTLSSATSMPGIKKA